MGRLSGPVHLATPLRGLFCFSPARSGLFLHVYRSGLTHPVFLLLHLFLALIYSLSNAIETDRTSRSVSGSLPYHIRITNQTEHILCSVCSLLSVAAPSYSLSDDIV